MLAAAVVALAVLLVLNGGDDVPVTVVCEPGTPGCELRQPVHWHADFALYIRGERYDFNQQQFFSTVEDELSENVHIHEPFHNVVHVHREGSTWREFFHSLGFELTDRCLTTPEGERLCASGSERLSFVINGVRVDALSFQDITDIDRALISFGAESEGELTQQYGEVTDEALHPLGALRGPRPRGGAPGRGLCHWGMSMTPCGKLSALLVALDTPAQVPPRLLLR
ncbi:MAG: hypothetical protein OXG61_00860 [Chloroflexi bacterium]|nr:hypothetical protein [Chloroflexota bacterium]